MIRRIATGSLRNKLLFILPAALAAQRAAALAADADPHARRHVPLLRGRREDLGEDQPAPPPRRGAGRRAGARAGGTARRRGDPHGLHPLGGDHGDLAQRGRRRGVSLARDHPRGGRVRDHRRRLRRGGADREDGRRRPAPRAGARGRRRIVRARAGPRHAGRPGGALDGGDRRDALGRRAHPARRPRRARPVVALRHRPPPRGGRRSRARRAGRRRRLADQHRRVGGAGARRRRARRGRQAAVRRRDGPATRR